jgi:ferric-dicitrate binding protein FerR (iron transport regulator)
VKARDIYMTGEALFKVAQDKAKPFTVYADNLATTALGTTFSVAEDQQKITISLYSGKVVVKPVAPIAGWTAPVYLEPGQNLVFNRVTTTYEIKKRKRSDTNTDEEKDIVDASPVAGNPNWYMFNNQPLTNVFSQLEEIYNVKIGYNAADMENVYFIGRFDKTDSIETILNDIALLKKLKILHRGSSYIITKK